MQIYCVKPLMQDKSSELCFIVHNVHIVL